MKVQILHPQEEYEIQLEQITQLCGLDFEKKQYIVQSLCKYFSNSKYASYEEHMQGNIHIEGESVGRKYFSIFHISSRENLLSAIKLSKSSLMFRYIMEKYTEFQCQNIMEQIAENLEQLYLGLNKDLQDSMHTIEIRHSAKSLMEIIQTADVFGTGERLLESLSNTELIDIYIDLVWEIQRRNPEKYLVIVDNIDHLLNYAMYQKLLKKLGQFCKEFDVWFLFLTSVEGYAVVEEQTIEGINVINHCIFSFPELERLVTFIQNQYPCQIQLTPKDICEEVRMIIQNIGNEEYSIHLKSDVLLKMLQKTLCITTAVKSDINLIEKAFITEKSVL